MDSKELMAFYEKLYCQELEERSRLLNRLQLPLGVLFALAGVIGYVIQNCPSLRIPLDGVLALFWIAVLSTLGTLGIAAFNFIRAWWPGTYQALPTALQSDQYFQLLQTTYDGFADKDVLVDKYFRDYLSNYYRDFSSDNAILNDRRNLRLSQCVTWVVWSGTAVSILFLFFQLADIKSYSAHEPTKVEIVAPVAVKFDRIESCSARCEPTTVNQFHIERTCTNDQPRAKKAATAASTTPATIDQGRCPLSASDSATQPKSEVTP